MAEIRPACKDGTQAPTGSRRQCMAGREARSRVVVCTQDWHSTAISVDGSVPCILFVTGVAILSSLCRSCQCQPVVTGTGVVAVLFVRRATVY